jgi:maltose-binding protein MalE
MSRAIWRTGTALVVLGALAALVVTSVAPAASHTRKASKVVIWTDHDRLAAVTSVANAWARARGADVQVVEKQFGNIQNDLGTVQAANAPDVVVAAHDWTGALAANGSVVPLFPSAAVKKQFPGYTLDAFSYGKSVKRLYGIPTQVENIALIVNTKLAHVPKSWADLESQALKFKKKKKGNLAIAVQQGANGDAYHMYPFFSGLCGYVFGHNAAGNLDPRNVGVGAAKFLRNSALVDRWNREGLINSSVTDSIAKNAFLKKQAAFYITGPWNTDTIKQAGIKFKIVQLPKIRCRSVPFLGVNGFMVTRFAAGHGVETLAKDLVVNYMSRTSSQSALAAAAHRPPANTRARNAVRNATLLAFGKASAGGVPMPNIPQMNAVWSELGGAWVKATKGPGATKARTAFATAARNIRNKIKNG